VNFRQPYLAVSLQDFWRRWHISLSTWLRDYLYIALGGNRKGERKTYRNLMATMLLGGLWHGANWTFVLWGGIHGAGLALRRWLRRGRREDRLPASGVAGPWGSRVVLFHLVCLAWIFFRAESLAASVDFLKGIRRLLFGPQFLPALLFLAVFSFPLFLLDLTLEKRNEEYLFETLPPLQQVAAASAFVFALVLFSANSGAAFIYFQF